MKIKWVSPKEYARLKEEIEAKLRYGCVTPKIGFYELQIWDEPNGQPMLVRIADTPLLRELL